MKDLLHKNGMVLETECGLLGCKKLENLYEVIMNSLIKNLDIDIEGQCTSNPDKKCFIKIKRQNENGE